MTFKLHVVKSSYSQKINLVCVFFWFSLIITDIARRIPMLSNATNMIRNSVYLVVFGLLFFIVLLKRKNYLYYFIPAMIFLVVFGLSYFFHPEIINLVSNDLQLFFVRCLVGFCLGVSIVDWDDLLNQISSWHWLSLAYALLIFFSRTNTIEDLTNYMSFSYALFIPATITLFFGFENKKILFVISGVIQMLVIALIGARGPVLCFLISLAFILFIKFNTKSMQLTKKVLVILLISVCVIVLIFSYNTILTVLCGYFPNSRTLIMISQGSLFESSERNAIYDPLFSELKRNPILPNGLFYDRIYLSNNRIGLQSSIVYPHNLILEIWFQFGLLGLLFLLQYFRKMAGILFQIIKNFNETYNIVFSVFCLAICCKMMISSTYISDAQFWFSIGTIINLSRILQYKDDKRF